MTFAEITVTTPNATSDNRGSWQLWEYGNTTISTSSGRPGLFGEGSICEKGEWMRRKAHHGHVSWTIRAKKP